MPLGGDNPLPFRIGGEDTPTQRTYKALASAVGKGGTGPAGGLRELWRTCVARAIATAGDAKDLAALQAFGQTMTVHLPAMERYLNLPAAPTEVDGRALVWNALTYAPDATGPNLGAELRAIDPNFSLDSLPWAQSSTAMPGKAFGPGPGDPGQPFGPAGVYSQPWCNASDSLIQRVRYYLPAGQTEIPQRSYLRAAARLCEVLPFYRSFEIYNCAVGPDGDGFYLDGGPPDGPDGSSLLDMTGL